jgi:hypothetical protein
MFEQGGHTCPDDVFRCPLTEVNPYGACCDDPAGCCDSELDCGVGEVCDVGCCVVEFAETAASRSHGRNRKVGSARFHKTQAE